MGQPISISGTTVEGTVAVFDTDRSITGQDGVAFASADAAAKHSSLPGDLAARLFQADQAIDHVFVASNQVVVRRDSAWDDAVLATASEIVARFLVFYGDD